MDMSVLLRSGNLMVRRAVAHLTAGVVAGLVMAVAAPAAAQGLGTSRVTAVTATIYARCDPASPARAVLERGAVVTIDAVNEGWLSVRSAGGEQGCMRRGDLEPTAAIDRAAQARRTREVSQARRGAAASRPSPRRCRRSASSSASTPPT